jgi:predicted nucleic acid-binding Zn ribbon protein
MTMSKKVDDEIRELHKDVAQRQYYQRSPKPIAESLSTLLARRGYAQVEAAGQRENVWTEVAGKRMAAHSRLGNARRGVLEVTVRNSAVLQELMFQKAKLLKGLVAALPDDKISDLRFRVGAVD